MKNQLFKIILLFSFFSGLSQNKTLELTFYQSDRGSFSNNDNIIIEYDIKNNKKDLIGSLKLNQDESEFIYFNINKEKVATEKVYETDKNISNPFDIKDRKSLVYSEKKGKVLFKKEWNFSENRFYLYSEKNILIGYVILNSESGNWELFRIPDYRSGSSNILTKMFKSNSNVVSDRTNKVITGTVLDDFSKPINGASIEGVFSNKSTKTDFEGNFSIDVSSTEALKIIHPDYFLQILYVDSKDRYRVSMKSKNSKTSKISKTNQRKSGSNQSFSQFLKNILKPLNSYDISGHAISFCLDANDNKRFGYEYIFNNGNSFGLTFSRTKSDLPNYEQESWDLLYDYDLALTYGVDLLYNRFRFKMGLGVYSYNYPTTESFGAFYNYTYETYYSVGLQFYLPIGSSGIITEAYNNNYGFGYGIGYKF